VIITLTGIDELTDILAVKAICDERPDVEFAALLTETPEGRNRYPSSSFICFAATLLDMQLAVHVCGSKARAALLAGNYDRILHRTSRIQVNGRVTRNELFSILHHFPSQRIITQHNEANEDLADDSINYGYLGSNHEILVDGSGGQGIVPDEWVRPNTSKYVGFAGGLSFMNLHEQIPRIAKVAQAGWWIDMESSLRNKDDRFDLDFARLAIRAKDLANV
jgi:hypothetical protein